MASAAFHLPTLLQSEARRSGETKLPGKAAFSDIEHAAHDLSEHDESAVATELQGSGQSLVATIDRPKLNLCGICGNTQLHIAFFILAILLLSIFWSKGLWQLFLAAQRHAILIICSVAALGVLGIMWQLWCSVRAYLDESGVQNNVQGNTIATGLVVAGLVMSFTSRERQ